MSNITKLMTIHPKRLIAMNAFSICKHSHEATAQLEPEENKKPKKPETQKMAEFRKKLKETETAGEVDIDDLQVVQVKEGDPFAPWPGNTNPNTGEIGGPTGPEPTRYGDWERKGICSDF